MRSPGASVAVTASATARRASWSVSCWSRASASSSEICVAVELDAEVGDELVEEAHPGAVAGDALLGVDPLLGLGEHVRAVAALGAQDVRVVRERRVGEQLLGAVVVDRDPLELEEQELGLDRRRLLARALRERAARLVGRVRGVAELGVRLGARDAERMRSDLGGRLVQPGGVELAELAAVALAERLRGGERPVEVGGEPRVVGAEVEVVEIPLDGFGAGHGCGHGETLASGVSRAMRLISEFSAMFGEPPEDRPSGGGLTRERTLMAAGRNLRGSSWKRAPARGGGSARARSTTGRHIVGLRQHRQSGLRAGLVGDEQRRQLRQRRLQAGETVEVAVSGPNRSDGRVRRDRGLGGRVAWQVWARQHAGCLRRPPLRGDGQSSGVQETGARRRRPS